MRPSNWTLLSWAVTFGEYGMYIAVIGSLGLAGWLSGLWWGDRRNRLRREAIQAAHDAAPTIEATPPDDEPDLDDPRTGTDQDALTECWRIWNRTPSREEQ